VIAVEGDRALGVPAGGLDRLQLLLAAEGLDRLVDDGVGFLVTFRPGRTAEGAHEHRQAHRTEEPAHEIASPCRGDWGADGPRLRLPGAMLCPPRGDVNDRRPGTGMRP